MTKPSQIITNSAQRFAAAELNIPVNKLIIKPVGGGFSLNRRALVAGGSKTIFIKEVDVNLLPDDGKTELAWLKKDYQLAKLLKQTHPELVTDWIKLNDDGRVLLMSAYLTTDDWLWEPPIEPIATKNYINSVIDATQQLENIKFDDSTIKQLSLQPYFRDKLLGDAPEDSIYQNPQIRHKLVEKYQNLLSNPAEATNYKRYANMISLLNNTNLLANLQKSSLELAQQPNDKFNHCDVRSDNLTYNPTTKQLKLIDWNWASYAPRLFGSTEFLLDMARRGYDVAPWSNKLNQAILATLVNFYSVRCLKPALAKGNNLRDIQLRAAATAYELFRMI